MIVLYFKRKLIALSLIIAVVLSLSTLIITAGSIYIMKPTEKKPAVRLPIIMYHAILKDKSKTGRYVITPEKLENDFLYLKKKGYESIFISDLINFVYKDKPLPEKPVIITFDDGYFNNLTYALPLLEKYNLKAVISVIGSLADKASEMKVSNPNYSYVSWEDIKAIIDTGRIEVGCHSYDMHKLEKRKGTSKLKSESPDEYKRVLSYDLLKFQNILNEKYKITSPVFTYPYGYISRESISIVKELGFLASLSCREEINTITKDEDCLYRLGRYNRDGRLSTRKFMKKID